MTLPFPTRVPSLQEVALADVRKEITFCRKVGLKILGIVENMSGFICPSCHVRAVRYWHAPDPSSSHHAHGARAPMQGESQIFPATTGGARALAAQYGCPFLGALPLDPRIGP